MEHAARGSKRASTTGGARARAGTAKRGRKEVTKERVDVGLRLRTLRIERNLSQRDLAASSGVTNGMISLIEQNKHSPSVATLNRITDALGIPFGEFFTLGQPAEPKIFFKPHELTKLVEGKLMLSIVAGNRKSKALQILHEVYQPGGDTGPEMLSHPGEEGGVIITGEVEITVGGQSQVLGPGDAYYFDSKIPHRFRNIGTAPAILVSACTPPF